MCGIAGIAGPGVEGRAELVERMLAAIYHRGPDEGGQKTLPGAVLGNRRLSIVDLAGGQQPIANEDGTIHVVFNGEIYDYEKHRRTLEAAGHRFRTRTDTEILVHRFEDDGLRFLDGLNGMWGLALHDGRDGSLYLARDRFGKKPLYYTLNNGVLSFASELKALLVDSSIRRQVDVESLNLYLTFECVPSPYSILKGIYKLPPGCLLVYKNEQIKIVRYWDVGFIPEEPVPTYGEAVEILRAHLDRAVQCRLVADVPVGVFLSGGIDSSTVAYFAARAHPGVKTFTVGFAEKSFDESQLAREVAQVVGSAHQERMLSASASLDLLPKVAKTLDEPFGDASIIPTYLLSAFTQEHLKVALGGDGGDEVFLGYPTYLAHRLSQYYLQLPVPVRGLIQGAIDRLPVSMENLSLDFKLRRFVDGAGYPPEVRNAVWLGSFPPEARSSVLARDLRDQVRAPDGLPILEELLRGVEVKHPLEKILYLDMKIYMSDDILVKVDRASMACSLEVRAPLLDYQLVDFVTRLPVEYRLRGFKSKALLKTAMEGRLPAHILHRSKKGFGMPVAHWIRKELRELVSDTFAPDKLRREGFLDVDAVQRLLGDHLAGRRDNRKQLWTLFMFEQWLENYGGQS
jgi:asparagine synthase (glutamine-hydrolysing)